jgi:UDP-glucose 4-epimerase
MGFDVLVTGGGGYIGTSLVAKLVAEGRAPLVTDKSASRSLKDLASSGQIRLLECDLSAPDSLLDECKDVTSLVHLAARLDATDDVVEHGADAVTHNLLSLINVLARTPKLRHVCLVSSIGVYADPPLYAPIDEKHPTAPINTYGVTKLAAEHYARLYGEKTGVAVTILRLCGVYGPGHYNPVLLPKRAVQSFIRRVADGQPPVIHGDGSERRDHVYIDDVVQAIGLALERRVTGVFNIATGKGVSMLELAQTVIELFGAPLSPVFSDAKPGATSRDYTLSISRAARELGYTPNVSLKEGLAREIEWFLKERATWQAAPQPAAS